MSIQTLINSISNACLNTCAWLPLREFGNIFSAQIAAGDMPGDKSIFPRLTSLDEGLQLSTMSGMLVEPSSRVLNQICGSSIQLDRSAVCAGFQMGKWRLNLLSRHMLNWLPFVALSADEHPPDLGDWEVWVRKAATRLFDKSVDPSLRGEIGEILLHIICRQQFSTYPTLCKLYYKSATNANVHGFDLVHTKYDADAQKLELWLGEAKFYTSAKSAIRDAKRSIQLHLTENFLEQEKMLVGPHIDKRTPGYDKLQWLLNDETSLDELFDRLIMPVLICYDSNNVINYCGSASDYEASIDREIASFNFDLSKIHKYKFQIKVIYLPLGGKSKLASNFATRVRAHQ